MLRNVSSIPHILTLTLQTVIAADNEVLIS